MTWKITHEDGTEWLRTADDLQKLAASLILHPHPGTVSPIVKVEVYVPPPRSTEDQAALERWLDRHAV